MTRAEIWKSNENQEEIHIFNGKDYVIGFNPKYIPQYQILKILDDLDLTLPVVELSRFNRKRLNIAKNR